MTIPELTQEERAGLRLVFDSLTGLHGLYTFDEALATPPVLGCMRNVLHAREKRLAQARARAARRSALEAENFQLT